MESPDAHVCCATGSAHNWPLDLLSHGVWLGYCQNPEGLVTSKSELQLLEEHRTTTNGGTTPNRSSGPHLDPWHERVPPDKTAVCAACGERPRYAMALRKMEIHGHRRLERVGEVWVLPCGYVADEMYAILRCENRRSSRGGLLWSFWKVDGGYTTDIFLCDRSQWVGTLSGEHCAL